MISGLLLSTVIAVAGCIAVVAAGVVASVRRRRTDRAEDAADGDDVTAHDALARARRRALVAVGFAVVVFVTVVGVGLGVPQLLGIPLGLAPGLAVSGGLLLFTATPSAKVSANAETTASLRPRDPWSFGPRWAFVLPLSTAAVLIAFLVWTGVNSSPDENGLYRTISLADATSISTSSPYPGWFYGVPLIAVTVILAVSTVLALRRVSATPSLPTAGLARTDRQWREASTGVITKLSTAALLGYFGGTAFIAGQATSNVATTLGAEGELTRQPQHAVGISLLLVGGVLTTAGLVFLILAGMNATTVGTTPARAAQGRMRPGSA